MGDFQTIPSHWSRLEITTTNVSSQLPKSGHLIVPRVPAVLGLSWDFAALLPNRDHNKDLYESLQKLPKPTPQEQPIVGCFLADPFLNLVELSNTLTHSGLSTICNYPSVSQYGSDFQNSLERLDIGFSSEHDALQKLRAQGFNSALVCGIAALDPAWYDLHDILIVAPSYDDLIANNISADRLLTRCQIIANATTRAQPILLIVGNSAISLSQAQHGGANAILL